MEILKFNVNELKDAIDNGKLISDSGFSGSIFLHGEKLLKLDQNLYHYLRINSKTFAKKIFERTYRYNDKPFVNKELIEYLLSKQANIHLTDFDLGIVYVNERICGSILTPHLDYQDLTTYSAKDNVTLLKILKNLLLALRELDLNQISHLDLANGEKNKEPTLNVLYKDTDIKLCDLSDDRFITYGKNFNPEEMYTEYKYVILYLIKKLGISISDLLTLDVANYEQANNMLLEVEKKLSK